MSIFRPSVAVIGAGPAGLAAACALSGSGVEVTIYEAGKDLLKREHNIAPDLAAGIGGAGLFSDGKFSYYPSGTHTYRLDSLEKLREAYRWLSQQLDGVEIGIEPFPDEILQPREVTDLLKEKKYPSHYASLEQRKELIGQLSQAITGQIVTNTKVHRIAQTPDGYLIEVNENNLGSRSTNIFSAVVLAMGKLGGMVLSEGEFCGIIPLKMLRFDFGLRIECHHSVGFMNRSAARDVKCLWQYSSAQFRTFCTCRRGEIWNIPYDSLSTISGRADGPATDYSNFGVLARFQGEGLQTGQYLWDQLRSPSLRSRQATWEPMGSFLQSPSSSADESLDASSRPWFPRDHFQRGEIRALLGEEFYITIKNALQQLLTWSPDLADRRTVCLFPVIEGTGSYPDSDENLRVRGQSIWCAGDIAGRFRGLIPALLSGYYVGLMIKESFSDNSI